GWTSERATLFLSAVAMTALAVAQPLLDLLGRTPEFFTARAAPASDVVLLGLLLGLVIPLMAGAVVLAAHRISPDMGRVVHASIIVVSGALLTLAVLAHTPAAEWPAGSVLVAAFVAGAGLAFAFRKSASTREVLRYAAVAPAVVVVLFLVVAPTSRLVWGTAGQAMAAGPVADPAPVVMVVFDEFPVATLIDGSGEIRSDQFPGFARLAASGTWFRNAVGVHERTEEALPTMLSGVLAPLDENVPSAADYPDNLFTLVGDGYRVEAVESVTALCPTTICVEGSRPRLSFATRWRSLGSDLAVVAGHVFLPDDFAGGLPPIDQVWGDFTASVTPRSWDLNRRFNDAVAADRRAGVTAFLDGFDQPLTDGELHFAHVLLPHFPWDILPDGRGYTAPRVPPGEWTVWTDDAWIVEQAYQRHLLQVQYVDRFVAELVDRLEASGSFDDTLLVVTADHGVAIRPGMDRRVITEDNVGEVAAVPLFVKRPGQAAGDVSDYRAESTDILPTIASLLGVDVPWRTSGVDLFAADLPQRSSSTMLSSEGSVTFGTGGEEKLAVARYHEDWFTGGDPFRLAPAGQHDLLGADVSALDVVDAPGVDVTLDQRYPMPDPAAGLVPAVISGVITGIPAEDRVVAIAVDGRVVAVTRTWVGGGAVEFQAMLPPAAFESATAPTLYLVDGSGSGRTLTLIGG
ncbi:MAG: sulfatase-like hydrolase/transferase, partial [Acidimicrobiia bacterium]